MPVDRSSCVDELSRLGGRLFGIHRWSVSPFHAVSVVGTVPVKTSLETIHCRYHHRFLTQIVPHVDYSVAEVIQYNISAAKKGITPIELATLLVCIANEKLRSLTLYRYLSLCKFILDCSLVFSL